MITPPIRFPPRFHPSQQCTTVDDGIHLALKSLLQQSLPHCVASLQQQEKRKAKVCWAVDHTTRAQGQGIASVSTWYSTVRAGECVHANDHPCMPKGLVASTTCCVGRVYGCRACAEHAIALLVWPFAS